MVIAWPEGGGWDLTILFLGLLVPIALGIFFTRPKKAGRPGR